MIVVRKSVESGTSKHWEIWLRNCISIPTDFTRAAYRITRNHDIVNLSQARPITPIIGDSDIEMRSMRRTQFFAWSKWHGN
jgi:hypothetical protein